MLHGANATTPPDYVPPDTLHRWAALCLSAALVAVPVILFTFYSFRRFRHHLNCSINRLIMIIALFELTTAVVMGLNSAVTIARAMTPTACEVLGASIIVMSPGMCMTALLYVHMAAVIRWGETDAAKYVKWYAFTAVALPSPILVLSLVKGDYSQTMAWCFISKSHPTLRFLATFLFAAIILIFSTVSFVYITVRRVAMGGPRYRMFVLRYGYAIYAVTLWTIFALVRFGNLPVSTRVPIENFMAFISPTFGCVNCMVFLFTEGVVGMYRGDVPHSTLAKTCADWSDVLEGKIAADRDATCTDDDDDAPNLIIGTDSYRKYRSSDGGSANRSVTQGTYASMNYGAMDDATAQPFVPSI